jgi:phosphoribosylaminoimidazole-succinocarboxamide synthase
MKLAQLEFLRPGSAKNIYRVDEKSIAFRFTDHYSVFDVGRAPDEIPGKAKAVCACAVKSFEIAKAIGVPTCFIEQIDPVSIRVKEVRIITDPALNEFTKNYLVPLELIYRLRVAGSILRDFKGGKKKPENYGLPAGIVPEAGAPFPYPIHMTTTKFEDIDRELTRKEALAMAGLTEKDELEFWSMIDRLTGAINLALNQVGITTLDGKMEVAFGEERIKMIADVFGTPDEDRWVFTNDLTAGKIINYSKEFIREIFIANGYYSRLNKARNEDREDPPIPKLSKKEIEEISMRYAMAAKLYASAKIFPNNK